MIEENESNVHTEEKEERGEESSEQREKMEKYERLFDTKRNRKDKYMLVKKVRLKLELKIVLIYNICI